MPRKPIILGLSFGHGDSSAALIKDDKVIAAVEEERFTRIKHYALFPEKSIQYCLNQAGIKANDISRVAIARKPTNASFKKIGFLINHPSVFYQKKPKGDENPRDQLKENLKKLGISWVPIVKVEHHLAHLASARYLSNEKEMALMSFDGLGDFVSATMGVANNKSIKILKRIYYPHSLGYFYTAITQFLGFPYFGDEFKVMGLSSFGSNQLENKFEKLAYTKKGFDFKLNLEAFPIHNTAKSFYLKNNQPYITPLFNSSFLTHLLGSPPRNKSDRITKYHQDLAKGTQIHFEKIANHLIKAVYEKVPVDTIGLAGGCAHNSVWAGKILQTTKFKNIHIAPASHDAGIAIGAAVLANKNQVIQEENSHSALLGPAYEIKKNQIFQDTSNHEKKSFNSETKLIDWMADELAGGAIMGLFKGRMEFGPRALGSRSIIASPHFSDMKDRLNLRIKHREPFRPFAASVLWEYQDAWFDNSYFAPTMEAVFTVKSGVRKKIPAVVHADNTCRIQSVKKEQQEFFWKLLEAFRKKTGIPMLINTSFNDCEPIVCIPQDAIRCFNNCDMDYLILDNQVISKKSAKQKIAS